MKEVRGCTPVVNQWKIKGPLIKYHLLSHTVTKLWDKNPSASKLDQD